MIDSICYLYAITYAFSVALSLGLLTNHMHIFPSLPRAAPFSYHTLNIHSTCHRLHILSVRGKRGKQCANTVALDAVSRQANSQVCHIIVVACSFRLCSVCVSASSRTDERTKTPSIPAQNTIVSSCETQTRARVILVS